MRIIGNAIFVMAIFCCSAAPAADPSQDPAEAMGLPAGADPHAVGRTEVLLDRAIDGAAILLKSPEKTDEATAAFGTLKTLREIEARYEFSRLSLCMKGILSGKLCDPIELPPWSQVPAAKQPSPEELEGLITELQDKAGDLCAAVKEKMEKMTPNSQEAASLCSVE